MELKDLSTETRHLSAARPVYEHSAHGCTDSTMGLSDVKDTASEYKYLYYRIKGYHIQMS
jgi:hypothetical protein